MENNEYYAENKRRSREYYKENRSQIKRRSHNVKNHQIFIEIAQEVVYQIYEFLDDLWNITGFTPNPIGLVAQKFNLTPTHILLVILAWRESRMKEFIYPTKGV